MIYIIRCKYLPKIAILLLMFILLCISHTKLYSAVDTVANQEDSIYLPIIMYHEVKPYKLGKDVISPYDFESDLKYLQKHQYNTITMTQLIHYIYGYGALPDNPIILSFDDGYLNNYRYVLPLLKKYNMKIVFSIIGKNTDDFTNIPDDNLDYSHVTWTQLAEMVNSGLVEVQNHTYNLHSNSNKRIGCMQKSGESFEEYRQVLLEDIEKLQNKIDNHIGEIPNTFTYPYGKSSDETDIILKEMGFKATLSCDYGLNLLTKNPDDLFGLKRIARSHSTSIAKILKGMPGSSR